jgi:hypothetical protein
VAPLRHLIAGGPVGFEDEIRLRVLPRSGSGGSDDPERGAEQCGAGLRRAPQRAASGHLAA